MMRLYTPSFPYFLPFPFLSAVRYYRPHLEGKDSIWGDDCSHSLHRRLLAEVFLSCKANARRSMHSPRYHFIITLSLPDRRDWRDSRGKWHLARNPDRSWWQRHISLKLLFCLNFPIFSYSWGQYMKTTSSRKLSQPGLQCAARKGVRLLLFRVMLFLKHALSCLSFQ